MKIFFSGIGGVGIGPLAQIAYYAGYEVTGSDLHESLLTDELTKIGVKLKIGPQDGEFLTKSNSDTPIDWLIYTSALPKTHPELETARHLNIKSAKRDELLSEILKDKKQKLIALAGTHGKTGTTALAVWLFKHLGLPISYSIGSTISFGPSGFYDSKGKYFIYECDEFDRNFLHFSPYLSIITSLEYDHPDTYPTKKDYLDAFKEFIKKSKYSVAWKNQPAEVYKNKASTFLLTNEEVNPDITLAGAHNRKNATLLLKGLQKIGVINPENYPTAITAINNFPGAHRRFEKLTKNLYTDYGHHPIEIEATLSMAKEVAKKNVVLVYQPHQNIRQHNIKDEYKTQFIKANKIYWLPTYLSREDSNLQILQPKDLTKNIINKDKIIYAKLNNDLWRQIKQDLANDDLVIGMGAGDIDQWLRQKSVSLKV